MGATAWRPEEIKYYWSVVSRPEPLIVELIPIETVEDRETYDIRFDVRFLTPDMFELTRSWQVTPDSEYTRAKTPFLFKRVE